jgi:hypothetical protein
MVPAGKSATFTAATLTAFDRYSADLSVVWVRLELHRTGEHQGQSEIIYMTANI